LVRIPGSFRRLSCIPVTSDVSLLSLKKLLLPYVEKTVSMAIEFDALVVSIQLKDGASSSDNEIGSRLVFLLWFFTDIFLVIEPITFKVCDFLA